MFDASQTMGQTPAAHFGVKFEDIICMILRFASLGIGATSVYLHMGEIV